jgi:hypothetical protein
MKEGLQAGDSVITSNNRTGKIIKMESDVNGSYAIVKLDALSGEYAFELSELRKVGIAVISHLQASPYRKVSREAV